MTTAVRVSEDLVKEAKIFRKIDNPSIGSEKKGDLRGVFIHKFKIQTS